MAVKIDVKSYVNRDRTKDVLDYINENDRIVKRNNRKTNEEFIEEVKALVGDKYTVLSEYVNAKTPIPIKHNTCGNIHNFTPNDFLSGTRCPACFRNFRKTQKQFEKEVCDKVGKEYTVLGKYKNTHTKIKMRHNCDRCSNYEYEVLPSAFLKGERCPACYKMTSKHTNEDFVKKVFELVGDEYTFLEPYITANTKIKVRHNCDKCGNYEYMVKPTKFVDRGCRCPKCQGEVPVSQEEFEQRVKNQVGDEFTVIGELINMQTPIKIRHNCKDCENYEFDAIPNTFLRKKNKCPRCYNKEITTPDSFEDKVRNIFGNKYTVLGKYVNYNTRVKVKCNECGYERDVLPSTFLRGYGCPNCNRMTTEKFTKKVQDITDGEYEVVGEYINNATKIDFIHKVCGTKFSYSPYAFTTGQKCPKCRKKNPRTTTEIFKQKVKVLYGDEYSVLGEYINPDTKILMKHNKCGNEWMAKAGHIIYEKTGCPICNRKSRKTTEDFKKEIISLVGNEYTVLGEFVNVTTKIKMRHNCKNCDNYEYEVIPDSFKRGARCPKCFGTHKKTTDEYIEEVNELEGNNYSVLGEYVNAATKVLMRHNKCGFEYEVSPNSFLRGHRCPKCIESRGEKIIGEFLARNNIKFDRQFKIADCKNILPLPFDFAVYDKNNKLYFLIEFQGEQHYREIDRFKNNWINVFHRDMIKRKYCFDNAIPLLTFTFWEYENKTLEKELEETFKPLMEFLI